MKRKASFGVVHALAIAIAGLSLAQCNQPPAVIAPMGNGGASGQGGNGGTGGFPQSSQDDAAVGGAVGPDAASVSINLDVIPIWYGEADAPHAPDLPPAPSVDANCGITTSETTRQPADVLLVLDRSASMDYSIAEDCYCTNAT